MKSKINSHNEWDKLKEVIVGSARQSTLAAEYYEKTEIPEDKREKLIELNTIFFVVLHELAHIMTQSVGHTDEFWKNFKFILKNAVKLNIYKEIDYSKYPKKYCGIEVTDSPLFNNDI